MGNKYEHKRNLANFNFISGSKRTPHVQEEGHFAIFSVHFYHKNVPDIVEGDRRRG
jgi:hypothetical protein